jgi:hypothetical protein
MGIVVAFCPPDVIHQLVPVIADNSVEAYGEVEALFEALAGLRSSESSDSAISVIDSDVLQVVYDVVTETADSEEVGVNVQGNPEALLISVADGASIGVGVGITALMSDGAQIFNNNPVIGMGTVDVDVYVVEFLDADTAVSAGRGIGLGIGILSAYCIPVEIFDNTDVQGTGMADVNAGAAEIIGASSTAAVAESCAAGIGAGIIVIGPLSRVDAEEASPECFQPTTAFVISNEVVQALGNVNVIAQAMDRVPDGDALAYGAALGVGLGIVVDKSWCPIIAENVVDAQGMGYADVYATAISTVDPYAIGVGGGIAVGIAAIMSPGAEIVDNIVNAYGYASGEVDSIEFMIMPAEIAISFGTTIGVGMGILIATSPFANVSDNTATAIGDADVDVTAEQLEPLEEAWSWAFAVGMGKGIVIFWQGCACVKESNVFEAGANVNVMGEAIGDFAHPCQLGAAIAIDAVIIAVPHGVAFNYNDMPGAVMSTLMVNGIPLPTMDWGMLALVSDVDARYNWWGDPTGPGGLGFGLG